MSADYKPELPDREFEPDDEFLRICLTTDISDPGDFMSFLASLYGRELRPEHVSHFVNKILAGESGAVARFWDVKETLLRLRELGFKLGVISNAWAFPVEHIFEKMGLGRYFDAAIFSYKVGYRKPDPEIYYAAMKEFDVTDPSKCFMVGDNVEADVRAAVRVGMGAALIDRPREIHEEAIADLPGVLHLTNLLELVAYFEDRIARGLPVPEVIYFDLWKTLVTSHCKEPVWNVQRLLGHNPSKIR